VIQLWNSQRTPSERSVAYAVALTGTDPADRSAASAARQDSAVSLVNCDLGRESV